MKPDIDFDVIIIGGGPVGLALAIDLGQSGISVCVIERYHDLHVVPKGQNMTQRTLENIDHWGCEPELRAARLTPRDLANGGLVTYGALLSDYAYPFLPREDVQPYYGQKLDRMPQYRTEQVLRTRAEALQSVSIRFGWSFEALTEEEEGVSIIIREHKGETLERLRAKFVVGCDGSHSPVRENAGIPVTLADHDRKMVLLVFESRELHHLLEERYGAPRAFYNALAPELNGYWRFLGRINGLTDWFFHAPVPADTTKDNTDFAHLLHEAVGEVFDLEVTYVGFWDLRFALADRYREERVLIAGDACHSHPPYGGYGINTGFEDARNLGWKLAATLEGWAGEKLLDSYDAERRRVFASTRDDFIQKFIENDRKFLKNFAPERDLKQFEAEWAGRNVGASEVFAFEPHYQGSPIVGGGRRPGAKGDHQFVARAGHHLAPRKLSDGRTTYQALSPGFTLFDFTEDGKGERFADEAAARGVPFTIVTDDRDGERADYEAALILVRPDGFVAWAGEDGDSADILARAIGA